MSDDIRAMTSELARDPGSLVFLRLAETLRDRGQVDAARKVVRAGLERNPDSTDGHDLYARVLVDAGDLAGGCGMPPTWMSRRWWPRSWREFPRRPTGPPGCWNSANGLPSWPRRLMVTCFSANRCPRRSCSWCATGRCLRPACR